VFFAVSLCLFLTTSTLLVSDYKQKDSLALRQAMASLPSFEALAFFANLPPFTSVTNAARETLVQVGWLGEDTWLGAKAGLNDLWSRSGQGLDKLCERTKMVVNDGVRLGGRVVEAVHKKLLVPALKWLQEPRRRGAPPPGHQHGPPKDHQDEQSHGEAGTRRGDGEKTGFPPKTTGPSQAEMEKQMKAKIAATTAYLNKEREQEEARKRKEGMEEKMVKEKMKKEKLLEDKRQRENMMKEAEEKMVKEEMKKEKVAEEKRHKENMKKVEEKESVMEDFKRLQARRREAEGRR